MSLVSDPSISTWGIVVSSVLVTGCDSLAASSLPRATTSRLCLGLSDTVIGLPTRDGPFDVGV